MNIEEQVELLMLGTEYGDEDLKKAMTAELRERLMLAQKETGRCGCIAVTTPHPQTCIWGTPLPCASCASFRIWDTKSLF